jgi:Tfp pilus assembly protein PilF
MPSSNEKTNVLARNIKANPDDSFSKFALALEFLKQDKLQQARVLFENIYANDPTYVGIYYHLGKLYERLDRADDAKQMYTEGIEVAANQKEKRTLKELKEVLGELNADLESD